MEFSINAVTRRQLFRGAAAFLGTLACSRVGYAATGREQDARALVSRLVEQVLLVISADGDGANQERRLMAAIESQTDLSLLARMTMGRYWRRASARQRERFVDVFRRYLLQSFISRLRRYTGTDLAAARDRFDIIGTQKAGKSDVVVRSRIKPPSGPPLKVDWRIRSRGDRLFIIDLVVEGVSLLITQRSEFSSVLERIGIDGLIGELQTRVARAI
ncbi:MAG: ABC transporter substrate-binding protein [Alphaproteobacteria bacterium]|nr:ABC transporter substrate-binding protein [Alphaproteobacteria bacterium]